MSIRQIKSSDSSLENSVSKFPDFVYLQPNGAILDGYISQYHKISIRIRSQSTLFMHKIQNGSRIGRNCLNGLMCGCSRPTYQVIYAIKYGRCAVKLTSDARPASMEKEKKKHCRHTCRLSCQGLRVSVNSPSSQFFVRLSSHEYHLHIP